MTELYEITPANVVSKYVEAVAEYQDNLNWVTGASSTSRLDEFDVEWGNHILLLADQAKLQLIEAFARQTDVLLDPDSQQQRQALYQAWRHYLATDPPTVKQKVDRQFQISIIEELQRWYKNRKLLHISNDFQFWLEDRDIRELFIIAASDEFQTDDYIRALQPLDQQTKEYVFHLLYLAPQRPGWPDLDDEVYFAELYEDYPDWLPEDLDSFRIDWLPARFWWRHLPTPS